MSNKKNIDRIFQERFKDFEATPPPAAWDVIEKNITTTRKPTASIAPLWLRYAAMAALVLTVISLGALLMNNATSDKDTISKEEYTDPTKTEGIITDAKKGLNQEAVDGNNTDTNNAKGQKNVVTQERDDRIPTSANSNNNLNDKASIQQSNAKRATTIYNSKNALAQDIQEKGKKTQQKLVNTAAKNEQAPKNNIAQAGTNSRIQNNTGSQSLENAANTKNTEKITDSQTTLSAAGNQQSNVVNTMAQNSATKNNGDKPTDSTINGSKEPDFINEAIVNTSAPKDSSATKKPSLTELAASLEEPKEEAAVPFKKTWSGMPVIAPRYSSSLGGSSIGTDFTDNAKSPGLNVSYGVLVGYHVAPKWSVRTGVHNVNMSYTTQGINYGLDVQIITAPQAFDPNVVRDIGSGLNNDFSQELVNDSNVFNGLSGELSQRLAYVEVPLEVSYKLIDRKVSLNVTGGMSAFFLTDNSVAVFDGAKRLDLGADSNFNDFHQSANLGLGLGYKFSDKLGAMIEPVFKYQLNTLRNDVANFRPYNLGLYTGISYTF